MTNSCSPFESQIRKRRLPAVSRSLRRSQSGGGWIGRGEGLDVRLDEKSVVFDERRVEGKEDLEDGQRREVLDR